MNCADEERGKGLTLFAMGYWRVVGVLVAAKEQKCNAGGINGKCGGTGFKTGDGRAGTFMCVCGGLSASGALASALEGGELRGLIKFNCHGMLNLRGNW